MRQENALIFAAIECERKEAINVNKQFIIHQIGRCPNYVILISLLREVEVVDRMRACVLRRKDQTHETADVDSYQCPSD